MAFFHTIKYQSDIVTAFARGQVTPKKFTVDIEWFTDYIPGHPDGEVGFHRKGDVREIWTGNPRIVDIVIPLPTKEWYGRPPKSIMIDGRKFVHSAEGFDDHQFVDIEMYNKQKEQFACDI